MTDVPAGTPAIPDDYGRYDLGMGYSDLLGPLYRAMRADEEWFGLRIEERHCNRRPMAHGGVLTSLADIVMGRLVVLQDPQQRGCLSVNLYLDFMDIAPLGCWLEAHARLERLGRQIAFTSCELRADGRLCAQGRSTLKYLSIPGTERTRTTA